MSVGNEKRRQAAHYGVKLDWFRTLANATDVSVQYPTWCCPLSNDNKTMHLVDILFAVYWLSFSWHFFIVPGAVAVSRCRQPLSFKPQSAAKLTASRLGRG